MSKQHFRTLLRRYRSGTSNEREKILVEQWFDLLDGDLPVRSPEQNLQIEERLWQAIQKKQNHQKPIIGLTYWRMAAAAIVLMIALWGGYQLISKSTWDTKEVISSDRLKEEPRVRRTNNTGIDLELQLADGTTVALTPQGSLEYPIRFASDRREVNLTGGAFFKVTRNPRQPFFVNTGEITTKVLGTSFRVEAGGNSGSVEVSVMTGKVAVFPRNLSEEQVADKIKTGVILTPNQRVVYSHHSQAFVTGLVKNPVVVPQASGKDSATPFIFEDTPLRTVLARMETAYGIEILLENDELGNCLFTADLTEQPLFMKLDLLCASLNATYEVRGTKILVSGSGCN